MIVIGVMKSGQILEKPSRVLLCFWICSDSEVKNTPKVCGTNSWKNGFPPTEMVKTMETSEVLYLHVNFEMSISYLSVNMEAYI